MLDKWQNNMVHFQGWTGPDGDKGKGGSFLYDLLDLSLGA